MATDQRYCLDCGHRRGEPPARLGHAFTSAGSPAAPGGAGRIPPPPARRAGGSRGRWSPNAILIAGVATLILAIGLGFLIGRAIHDNSPRGGGAEHITIESDSRAPEAEVPAAPPAGESAPRHGDDEGPGPHAKPGDTPTSKQPPESDQGPQAQEAILRKKNQETLHPTVPLAKPKAKLGEPCEPGTAGCGKNHKFEGVFFGTEE